LERLWQVLLKTENERVSTILSTSILHDGFCHRAYNTVSAPGKQEAQA
jgi:hypothetical protein